MPALPKPHRVAFLLPDVKIEGPDGAYEREAAALLWVACIEACQRHPRLAVLDADATPLLPQDGHFAPQHAGKGGRANDAFYAPTRRDEVLWLELMISNRPGVVRLHTVGRDGKQETFDALGPKLGEQIQRVLGAWLAARGLGPLPRRFDQVSGDEVLAVLRVVAPTLAEQARAWQLPVASKPTWSLAIVEDEAVEDEADEAADDGPEPTASGTGDDDDDFDRAFDRAFEGGDGRRTERSLERPIETTIDSTLDLPPSQVPPLDGVPPQRSISRPLVNRLPMTFRLPALRLLELALREELGDAILAVDPVHPQAMFARFEKLAPHGKDFALLRQVIASAPA